MPLTLSPQVWKETSLQARLRERIRRQNETTLVFFSALLAFALQEVLETPPDDPPDMVANRGLLFCLAVLLFLRFLFGSTLHLWYEHEDATLPPDRVGLLAWHHAFIVLFGLLGVYLCAADSVGSFLLRLSLVPLAGIAWGIVDGPLRLRLGPSLPRAEWRFEQCNWIQFTASLLAWFFYQEESCTQAVPPFDFFCQRVTGGPVGWSWVLIALLVVHAIVLGLDFRTQSEALYKAIAGQPKSPT